MFNNLTQSLIINGEQTPRDPGIATLGLIGVTLGAIDNLRRQDNAGIFCAAVLGCVVVVTAVGIFSTAFTTCNKIYPYNDTSDIIWIDKVGPYNTQVSAWGWAPKTYLKIDISSYHTYTDIYTVNNGHFHWGDTGRRGSVTGGPNNKKLAFDSIFWWTCYYNYEKGTPKNSSENSFSNMTYSQDSMPSYVNLTDVISSNYSTPIIEKTSKRENLRGLRSSQRENLGFSFKGLKGAFYQERKEIKENHENVTLSLTK